MVERKSEERGQASKFQPSSEWVQDPSNYILLIQLPGFKKDDIRVIVNSTGRLTVKGTKQESSSFEQSYSIPTGSNIDKITGKFENNCLMLIFPKPATVEPEKTYERKKEESLVKEEGAQAEKQNKEKKLDKLMMEEIEKFLEERESRKIRLACDVEEDDWMTWLNGGLVDAALEKVNRNRKVITVALMAFSIGFYVSNKLKTRGE